MLGILQNSKLSLLQRFNVICIAALFLFGSVFGWIVNRELESHMLSRAKALTAQFCQHSVLKTCPVTLLRAVNRSPDFAEIDQKLSGIAWAPENILQVKVWNRSGRIIWSNEASLIGREFLDNEELVRAFMFGDVLSELDPKSKVEHVFEDHEQHFLELYIPIESPELATIPMVVEIYQELTPLYSDLRESAITIWMLVVLGMLLLYSLLFGLVRRASIVMKEQTENLLNSKEQLIQADKMVSLGVLSAGVAHEINNPNQHILTNANLFEKAWSGVRPIVDRYHAANGSFSLAGMQYSQFRDRLPGIIQAVRGGSERISRIVDQLQKFSRQEPSTHSPGVDLNSVVVSAATLLESLADSSNADLSLDLTPHLPLANGNYQRLEQVVVNLLLNAFHALPDHGGKVNLSTCIDWQREKVVITVIDDGTGISSEDLSHVMDPFFTTKRETGGTGLGLSISQTIVDEHQGSIHISSKPNEGTQVSVDIPIRAPRIIKPPADKKI